MPPRKTKQLNKNQGGEPGDGGSVIPPPPVSSSAPAASAAAAATAAAAAAAAAASADPSSSFDPTARQRTAYSRAGLSIAGFYYLRLCRLSGRIEGLYFDPSAGSPFQKLELAPAPARVRPASACYFDSGRRRSDDDDEGREEEKIGGMEGKTEAELEEKEGGAGAGAAGGEGSDGEGLLGGAASDDGGASSISSFAFN